MDYPQSMHQNPMVIEQPVALHGQVSSVFICSYFAAIVTPALSGMKCARMQFVGYFHDPMCIIFPFLEQWRDGLFDCFGVAGPSSFCMSFCFPACTPCIFAKISSRIRSERILGRCASSLPDRAPESDHNLIIMNQSFIVTKLVLNTVHPFR